MSIITNPTMKSTERAFALQKYLLLHSQHDALKKRIENSRESSMCSSPSSSAPHTRRSSMSLSSSPPTSRIFSSPVSPISENSSSGSDIISPSHSPIRGDHHSSRGISALPGVVIQNGERERNHHRSSSSGRRSSLPSILEHDQDHLHYSSVTAPIHIPHPGSSSSVGYDLADDELQLMNINQQIKTTLTELLNCASVRGDRQYRMWIQTRLMDVEQELKHSRRESIDACRRRSGEFAGLV